MVEGIDVHAALGNLAATGLLLRNHVPELVRRGRTSRELTGHANDGDGGEGVGRHVGTVGLCRSEHDAGGGSMN